MSAPPPGAPPARGGARLRLEEARVAVLAGGSSPERTISLESGRAVLGALGRQDRRGPAAVLWAEIGPDARWRVDAGDLGAAEAMARLAEVDLFFLALHGGSGEDGTIQGFLETCGARYTGSGVAASALCMDKLATRALAGASGIATARGAVVGALEARSAAELEALLETLGRERVVKPRHGGSSVETWVASDAGDLARAVRRVLATGDECLVEERVPGTEVSVGVLGNRGEPARVLPPVEIRPAAGRIFDYGQKYGPDGAEEICPPRSLGKDACRRIERVAETIYRAAGCDGYARVDMIVRPEGEPVLLEVNTLPGLTARSLLPRAAAAAGLEFRDLCLEILGAALRRAGGGAP